MREDIIHIIVLFAVGAIMAVLIAQGAAVASGFKTLNEVFAWAQDNAFGNAPRKEFQKPSTEKAGDHFAG